MPGAVPEVTPGVVVPPGGRGGRFRSRRARLWLALSAGILALLCLGGAGVIFLLYDDATEIERSAPDAVVDNFLGAYFVSRSDSEAALYMCKEGGAFSELSAFRADIENRERSHGVGILVSWSTFTVETREGRGSVTTDLTKATESGKESITRPWKFEVVEQDGWRVCGAKEST